MAHRLVAIALLFGTATGCSMQSATVEVDPSMAPAGVEGPTELQRLIESLPDGAHVRFAPGDYHLSPVDFVDDSCANCDEPQEHPIHATRGLLISGRDIFLTGPVEGEAVLHTNSGYGLYFDGCQNCVMTRLTVTDGVRDPDARASDAAVVVKRSSVTIARSTLRDNLGDESVVKRTVVGIIGVAGREDSSTLIEACRILRNSWDGIALYRGASATIVGNVIDGVDAVAGRKRAQASGGRGVGIGLTWDARAVVEGNLVRRYWKGIGVFVDARASVRGNVVEDVLTWGIALWDAGKGRPELAAKQNLVFGTGACGASLVRAPELSPDELGVFLGNAIVRSGQSEAYDEPGSYCSQEALAVGALPSAFRIDGNLFLENREAGGAPGQRDRPPEEQARELRELRKELQGEPALAASRALAWLADVEQSP